MKKYRYTSSAKVRMVKVTQSYKLLLLCCLIFSGSLYAQCSAYMNQAAINEISTNHNWKASTADFVELRLIDSSIDSSIYNSWAVYVCTNVCLWTHVSNFTKIDSYLIKGGGAYSDTIDWNAGFAVWLIDQYGFTIDYVSVNGNSVLYPACTTPRDSTATSDSSTRRTRRLPDANGDWDTPPGNSVPPTEGENNVSVPAGAGTLALADATTVQGNDMVFNLSIPSNTLSVVITYSTVDGTATAGTDYTATTGAITIPAGTTSASISVPTLVGGSASTFYLVLDSVTNANAPDQYAVGIITTASGTLNHFRYEYDGNGLTCEAETITIKACANADCSTLYGSSVALTFQAAITAGTSVSSNLSFTGSTTLSLAEGTVTTVTMSKTASVPAGSLICYQGGAVDGSCNYDTSDTGFIFLNETDSDQVIPTQLSGKSSDTGYNSKTIVLQAVQTDTTTGVCAALFVDNTDVPVDLAFDCENPSSCIATANNGNDLAITNNNNTFYLSELPTYVTHNLRFGANSKATIAINYPDAGEIKLYAKKFVTLLEGETRWMSGNSNSFVVRPFGLSMSLTDNNPAATNNAGGVFARAGGTFDTTVSAVQWVSGEDTDNNGIPDSGANISDNSPTLNFGKESSPVGVSVTHSLVSPSGGDASVLSNGAFSGFSSGVKTQSLSWNNVGIISLSAALSTGTYLGTDTLSASIPNLGRFIPNHFRLKSSSIAQTCTNFTYMGQTFNLSIDLQAQGVGDIALSNYSASKGVGTDNHALGSYAFVVENSDSGVALADRLSLPAINTTWDNGSITHAYTPNFERSSVLSTIDGPFNNVFVGMTLNDGEVGTNINLIDVDGSSFDMNGLTVGDCSVAGNCDALKIRAVGNLAATEVAFRYGRLNSSEVFGPASASLTFPIFSQFWNGTDFVLSTDDSCTTLQANEINISTNAVNPFAASYNVKSLLDDATVGTTTIDITPANITINTLSATSGNLGLVFNAPNFSSGAAGYVPVFVELGAYPWLQFDWDTNGTGAVDATLPLKNVTFGQFRGNDRVIYRREVN